VKEAVRDLEFATNIEVHRATCEALRRLLPNGSSPTLKEVFFTKANLNLNLLGVSDSLMSKIVNFYKNWTNTRLVLVN
jgi:hypothetical protein